MAQLKDRLASANINQVKSDVLPFVRNPKELDIWSNDYFVQLADMVKFEQYQLIFTDYGKTDFDRHYGKTVGGHRH